MSEATSHTMIQYLICYTAFRILLILTWIRIRILGSTFGKSGSRSMLIEVDPDPAKCSGSGWILIWIRNADVICISYIY